MALGRVLCDAAPRIEKLASLAVDTGAIQHQGLAPFIDSPWGTFSFGEKRELWRLSAKRSSA